MSVYLGIYSFRLPFYESLGRKYSTYLLGTHSNVAIYDSIVLKQVGIILHITVFRFCIHSQTYNIVIQ